MGKFDNVGLDGDKVSVRDKLAFVYTFGEGKEHRRADAAVEMLKRCGTVDGKPISEDWLNALPFSELWELHERLETMLIEGEVAERDDVEARAKN